MSKLLLILDSENLNDACLNCPCCFAYVSGLVCSATDKYIDCEYMPDWCPLRPMPSHLVDVVLAPDSTLDEVSYMTGWNDCLDAITGEEEE